MAQVVSLRMIKLIYDMFEEAKAAVIRATSHCRRLFTRPDTLNHFGLTAGRINLTAVPVIVDRTFLHQWMLMVVREGQWLMALMPVYFTVTGTMRYTAWDDSEPNERE